MKLGRYLEREGISLAQFAKVIGVSQESVRLYIAGERFPRPKRLEIITAATCGKVTYRDFMAREGSI